MGFKVGDEVRLSDIVAEVVGIENGLTWLHIPGTQKGAVSVCLEWHPDWTVEPVEPADWPPQVGDIWEADGHEFTAYGVIGRDGIRLMRIDAVSLSDTVRPIYDGIDFDEFKALNPTLIRRRDPA